MNKYMNHDWIYNGSWIIIIGLNSLAKIWRLPQKTTFWQSKKNESLLLATKNMHRPKGSWPMFCAQNVHGNRRAENLLRCKSPHGRERRTCTRRPLINLARKPWRLDINLWSRICHCISMTTWAASGFSSLITAVCRRYVVTTIWQLTWFQSSK